MMQRMIAMGSGSSEPQGVYVTGASITQAKQTLGFKPKYLLAAWKYSAGYTRVFVYDETVSTTSFKIMYNGTTLSDHNLGTNDGGMIYSIDDDGFTIDSYWSSCSQMCYYAY